MLFSREEVAAVINRDFEPAWEMVREVPIIRIDFGGGREVTRTLHGNIASYVCCSDGQVVDILPGIYTPTVYTTALELPRALAVEVRQPGTERRNRLHGYHRDRAQTLRLQAAAARLRPNVAQPRQPAPQPEGPRPKRAVEMRTERIVMQPVNYAALFAARPRAGADLANWELLVQDTARIEAEHRLVIHDRLAQYSAVWPEQIKKWLYKEVLHADITDPYLGLGDALIGDDIFRQGEA